MTQRRSTMPSELSEGIEQPYAVVQEGETLAHMLRLTCKLDDREQKILKLRFGLGGERPRTLEEVSQTIGRTRERVRQIQNQALEKLRMMLEEEGTGDSDK